MTVLPRGLRGFSLTGFRPAAALAFALTLAAAIAVTGCSGDPDATALAPADPGPAGVYVAIGSDETIGTGLERPFIEAWPRLLYRAELERGAVLVNAASAGSTVAEALEEQLPLALELEPTLATVWLNLDDVTLGVPVVTYERQLADLVRALRRDGRTEVLVANAPPGPLTISVPNQASIDQEIASRITPYNDAIARVAAAEGATLVDLHAAAASSPPIAHDGQYFTPEGNARVAEIFADAL